MIGQEAAEGIVPALRAIQERFGYLPLQELRSLAQNLRVPLYELHGVASFFPHFRLEPPPSLDIQVCRDLSCTLAGGTRLEKRLRENLGVPEGSGRGNGSGAGGESGARGGAVAPATAIRGCSCLGQCDSAPALAINDRIYAGFSDASLDSLLVQAASGASLPHRRTGPMNRKFRTDPHEDGRRYGAARALAASGEIEPVLAKLRESGLVGMGGAGFKTALKWELVRKAAGDVKFVVCNADESEVGTIKDREIMKNLPHLLIEGMLLAGIVTGARKGYIYIRHEYEEEREILQHEIDRCYGEKLLGRNLLGSAHTFDLEIYVSPGGYICGEESALLEAMEGKRAQPRNKPPFPVTHGLWNKPTCLNNVETFSFVPLILVKGPEHFRSLGMNGSVGLKWIGVSGHVVRPGVFEIPMGLPAREAIFNLAGGVSGKRVLKAFTPSGASSGFLPASKVDTPLSFEAMRAEKTMLGSGAIVVLAEGTCMVQAALNTTRFFRNESCGKCVPCRVGSEKMVEMLEGWTRGEAREGDLDLIAELTDTLALTSICGLGMVVPEPIVSAIRHFPDEVREHVRDRRCREGGCPGLAR